MRPTHALLTFALILLAPTATSAKTLADFEEPFVTEEPLGAVLPFQVTPAEAGRDWIVIFRGTPGAPFNLSLVDESGATLYGERGSRGVRTLPEVTPGDYRFTISNAGSFQVARGRLDAGANLTRELVGSDAYVAATSATAEKRVTFAGNVTIEAWDLVAQPEPLAPGAAWRMPPGHVVVYTVRGADGSPYTVTVEESAVAPSAPAESPGPGLALLAATISCAALIARRSRR